jgi:hypothetical protein
MLRWFDGRWESYEGEGERIGVGFEIRNDKGSNVLIDDANFDTVSVCENGKNRCAKKTVVIGIMVC